MKNAKKLLSVILSVIMIMSSCSVCFGTITFAANNTNAVNNFVSAVQCDAMKSFKYSKSSATSGSGKDAIITKTFTYLAPSYEYFTQVVNVLEKFHAAMTGLDEYTKGEKHNNNGNCAADSDACTDLGHVRSAFEKAIGDSLDSLNQNYNLDDFFDCVLNMDDITYRNTESDYEFTGSNTTDTRKVPQRVHNKFVAKTDDLVGYITSFDSADKIAKDNADTEYTYTLSMCRQNYQTGGWWKTNHYHHAINTNNSDAANPAPSVSATTATNKADLVAANEVFTKYANYFGCADVKDILAISQDATALSAVASEIQGAYDKIKADFSSGDFAKIYNHFFSSCNVASTLTLINNAVILLEFKPIADDLKALCATDYSEYTKAQLLTLLNTLNEKYAVYKTVDATTQALIVEIYGLDTAKVEKTIEDVDKAYQVACIKEAKTTADAHKAAYGAYDIDGVDEGTVTAAMITEAVALIGNDITALEKYNAAYVAEVCGANYVAELKSLKTSLTNLGRAAGYNESFLKEYEKFAGEIENPSSADSQTLTETLKKYDEWYKDLKALIDEMKTELGEDIAQKLFDELDTLMTEHMDAAYLALNTRVETQIENAYVLYTAYVDVYGEKVIMSGMSSYNQLKASVGLIDTDAYNFLNGNSENFTISEENVEKYNKLQKVMGFYATFEANRGFDTYTQTTIDDIIREESTDDIAREGDYTVTDENVEKVIDVIETALKDENIQSLLGFDLASLLDGALDSIYTDSVINSIIQYVYPAVANEFVKAWADLPSSITIEDVDTGMGFTADVECELTIDSVETAIGNVGVNCFPITLGALIEKDYPQYKSVAETLKKATTPAVKGGGDPWKDAAIYTEDGKALNLQWGVTDKESFIDAAVAALSGLEPLLLAIVSNQSFKQAAKIGTGSGDAVILGFIPLGLTVDPIELVLMSSANDGYDNALAPIFEALGCTDIPHGETLTSTRAILEDGLFKMLDQFLDKLAKNPVKTILEILPNIAYALEADLVNDLLGMLKTDITYTANASYQVLGQLVTGSMNDVYNNYDKPEKVNIKDMVDLKSLGVDISSFEAVWDMILGLLKVSLPAPDAGAIATMGELTWKDTNRSEKTYTYGGDKAAFIVADKADLLIYLVRYVLENDLISMLFDLENADDIIKEIMSNLSANSDDVIAAVVELLNQIEYTVEDYVWYDGKVGGTVEGLTPAMEIYLSSNNNWNTEVAHYVTENINTILDSVLTLAGLDVDISAELNKLISSLFTNANVTELAKLLSGIDLSSMPELNDLIKNELNIDLSVFASYKDIPENKNWGFTDGDGEGFVGAIIDLLSPFDPVLDFILSGEDITLFEGTDGEVRLIGYDGYDSAIIPLIEALGIEAVASGDLGESSPLKATLDSVLELIDNVVADPIYEIIDLIPGLVYFIASNGLSVAVRNLLQPVYVILDTIRPIYDLDLDSLLASLINGDKKEGDEGYIDFKLDEINVDFIVEIVEALTGLNVDSLGVLLYDVSKVIGEEYTSSSTLFSADKKAKRGEYTSDFDRADMVTVVLSFAIEYLSDNDNAKALDELLGTDGFMESLISVFEGTESKYMEYNWMYYFGDDYDFTEDAFRQGISIKPTMASLDYPNNWTEDTAKYIDENLTEIVNDILSLMGMGTIEELLGGVEIYSSENVRTIINLIADLIEGIDETLLEAVGMLLDVDINAFRSFEVPDNIDTAEEFAGALADALANIDGLVKWLFFGENYEFFLTSEGKDAITIYGADGYAKGLAYILEALGCENLPSEYSETAVYEVLLSAFKLIDKVLAQPIDTVLNILPNVIYFINADGLTVGVNNTLSAVYALLETLEGLGLSVDLDSLIADLTKDLGFTISLSDLSMDAIMEIVSKLLKMNLSPVEDVITELCVGKIQAYNAIGGDGYKMYYDTDFARYDMITIILTVLLETIELKENEQPLKDLLGEEAYDAILAFYNMLPVDMQEMSYILTEYEGQSLSAIANSELYENWGYGPRYTKEMAEYIAENFGRFIDNIIYLLGIEINGVRVDTLKDTIYALLDGSLYTAENANSLLELLKSLPEAIAELTGDAGVHINAVLKTALGVDFTYWDNYVVGEVKDRQSFVNELCNMLKPFYPVLKWLLAGEDFTFFVDDKGEDIITLLGAEGYAYGVIPVLEAFQCGGVLTVPEYNKAVSEDESALITTIINPLLDKVDYILAAESPADEILAMLPAIIYFINSNGLDTCFKNILNAVYTLLNAIEPIVVVDIYELIGLDLSEITFESLFDMLIKLIYDSTGYNLSEITADTITELTVGTVVSYTSANGKKAYTMVYSKTDSGSAADMVTVLLRLALTFLGNEKNVDAVIGLLSDYCNMDESAQEFVGALLKAIIDYQLGTRYGMDQALATVYYVFYGTDIGANETAGAIKDVNAQWIALLKKLGMSDNPDEATVGNLIAKILDLDIFKDIIDTDTGIAPNGFVAFFQKIIAWFNSIFGWIKNIFS